jgi:hypothetical protein
VENLWKTAVHISCPIWVKFHTDIRIILLTCFVLVGAGKDILLFLTQVKFCPIFYVFIRSEEKMRSRDVPLNLPSFMKMDAVKATFYY